MINPKDFVPNIDKMIDYKCLHCDQIVLNMPGELRALYCISKGQQHEDIPSIIWAGKIPVTIFNYNGKKSKKAWLITKE